MAEQIKIILPEAVKKIINVLQSAGYEAWAVGGCVRDSILHREPDDWDITTVVSSYSGYRYSAWNSHCFDG